MPQIFNLPRERVFDNNADPLPGAKLNFYKSSTSTRKDTYTDQTLTTAHSNPVVADADGEFPVIWLSGIYKIVLTDADDVEQWTVDPYEENGQAGGIDNLKALVDATALQVDGLQVQMRAFYSDTDTGGGHFYWDTDRDKSDANGGTIIDPDNVGTLSATSRGTFASTQGTGSGNGVWVRLVGDHITHEDFGLRDGETNGSETIAALKNCWEWAGTEGVTVVDDGNSFGINETLFIETWDNLHLDFARDTRIYLTALPSIQIMVRIINGGQELVVRGGHWDANGQFSTADTSGNHIIQVLDAANRTLFDGCRFEGNYGADDGSNGKHQQLAIQMTDKTGNPKRYIDVINCDFQGTDDTTGRGLKIEDTSVTTEATITGIANIENNKFENFLSHIFAVSLLSLRITGNDMIGGDRGIVAFGEKGLDTIDFDPSTPFRISVFNNRISLGTGSGQGGIVMGTLAGPGAISHNVVYMPEGSAFTGISIDPPHSSDNYESRLQVLGNVVRGGKVGISSNSPKHIIQGNHISHCSLASIRVTGANFDRSHSLYVTGNICEGAPIQVGGGSDKHSFLNVVGENILVGQNRYLVTNKQTVSNEAQNTQQPVLVERFDDSDTITAQKDDTGTTQRSITNKGIAAKVWEFDASNAALNDVLPSTFGLHPGQEFTAFRWAGTNTITLKPDEATFNDGGVDTTANTIRAGASVTNGLFDLRSSDADGKPVRISNRDGGTMPGGLTAERIYYFIFVQLEPGDIITFSLAETEADALAGTAIDITSTGDATTKYFGDILYDSSRTSVASVTVSEMEQFISGRGAWYQL